MDDLLRKLVTVWRTAGLVDDPESIADSLWLASFLPPSPKSIVNAPEPDSSGKIATSANSAAKVQSAHPAVLSDEKPSSGEDRVSLFSKPAAPALSQQIAASPLSIASPAALPNALSFSRALRPFSRRFASRTGVEFDEQRTAEESISYRHPVPRYRPLPERWFDIALVVENAPSMAIWRSSLQEFRTLLERQGSFRDIRTWRLQPSGKLLYAQTTRHPEAVGDTSGRRLILIASDCISDDWSNGVIASLVLRWAKQNPIAIVQMLPPRAWIHTAVGDPSSTLPSSQPGTPTWQSKTEQEWWAPNYTNTSVTVPVVPLDADQLLSWARMCMAMKGATHPGVRLETKPIRLSANKEGTPRARTPRIMLDAYQSMVSAEAFELATYLAAAPLSLPVMRLVQQAMFGDRARQFHLAEFFLGGLIRKESEATDPENTVYDYHDGIRALLLETLDRKDAFEVIRRVSEFIESRIGIPLSWTALAADPSGVAQLPDVVLRFASVAKEVAVRLGTNQQSVPGKSGLTITPVPKPSRSGYNPNRRCNSLIIAMVMHFAEADRNLPPALRTGVDTSSIVTEGQAASYIRAVTEAIHGGGGRRTKVGGGSA